MQSIIQIKIKYSWDSTILLKNIEIDKILNHWYPMVNNKEAGM